MGPLPAPVPGAYTQDKPMKPLHGLRPLLVVAGLALAVPLAAFADAAGPMAGDQTTGGAAHEHEMSGCPMHQGMGHGMGGGMDGGMDGGMEHGGMMHGGAMFGEDDALPPPLRRLHLSEAQQDKIFAIMHAQAPQAREFRKAMHKAHR